MSKDYCLSLDKPVQAEISKVLNAYRKAYEGHHSKTDQADYDAMSDAAELEGALRPTRQDIDAKVLDTPFSFVPPDPSIPIDDTLEINLHRNTPFYEFYKNEGGTLGEEGGTAEFLKKRIAIQQEFVKINPGLVAFDLTYNDLTFFNDPVTTPLLNEFLNLYDSLSAVCPEDFEKETEILYKKSLVDYFKGKKIIDFSNKRAVPFSINTVAEREAAIDRAAFTPELQDYFDRLEKFYADRLETEVENIFAEVKLYQEQCFVLSQITSLIEFKKNNLDLYPRLPYVNYYTTQTTGAGKKKTEKSEPIRANAPIMIQGEPFRFMNKMVQYQSAAALFNLTTAQISSLVPTIRLYRVETNPSTGKDIGVTEIKFDPNPSIKSYEGASGGSRSRPTIVKKASALDLFNSKRKRGVGVGLESFDFTFHGSDPFAVKKAISAKLSIFATSFGDLIAERDGYKFADLALKTGKTPDDLKKNLNIIEQQNLDKLNFRLKAVVGWAIPKKDVGSFDFSEIDAVRNSFVTLNLTPTTHEFNFDEMGGVSFTINYLAYIEDYFNQTKFNIFSDPKLEAVRNARKLFYEFLNTEGCDQESLDLIKEADSKVIENEKRTSFSSILKRLRRQNKLLTYNLSYDDISKFLRSGKIDDAKKLVPKAFDATSTKAIQAAFSTYSSGVVGGSETERSRVTELTQDDNSITFFFISDLLSVVMESIDDSLKQITEVEKKLNFLDMINSQGVYDEEQASRIRTDMQIDRASYQRFLNARGGKEYKNSLLRARAQFEKLRLVLGPVEFTNPFKSSEVSFCSLGDIPLSLNYFTEFLTKKMIGRDETYYPLTNFVKDLVNEVIKNFLNNDGCFDFSIRQKLKLNSSVITAYAREDAGRRKDEDDLTDFIRRNGRTMGQGGVLNLRKTPFQPVLEVSGPDRSPVVKPPLDREYNYYVFYAGRQYPVDLMTGDAGTDARSGIFHYVLGKDRGIVKNISLDRTDMTGLKELRFEKEGFDGLTQLREVYNASIDSFLNVSALPGCYIYVDPQGFSPEADINFSQFGIGGYYMITRAEHSISPGKADTKIVSKWVADTNGRFEAAENDNVKVVDRNPQNRTSKKCLVKKKEVPKERLNETAVEEINKRSGGTGHLYGVPGKKA